MRNLLCILLLVLIQQAFSQDFSLDKIELKDTILEKTIKNFIEDRKTKNVEFVTKGYVEVRLIYLNRGTLKEELRYKYSIVDQYFRPKGKYSTIPTYYCYINEKLVLFYDSWSDSYKKPKYKKKTMRKLVKLLKPYFDKPKHIKVRDSTGKVIINDKDFVEEGYNLHGGIELWVYADGKTKITTYWDQFKKKKKEDKD